MKYRLIHIFFYSLVHENHYLVNSARRWVIPLYCRMLNTGDPLQITDDMLERKIGLCKGYLKVLDKIERGLTKNRGIGKYKQFFHIFTASIAV